MPVLAIFTNPAITKGHYEALRKEVAWETKPAPGGIFHAASFDDQGGIHVADVWESGDALNQFVSSRLMPAMQKLGIPAPAVAVYPLHNANAYEAVTRFVVKSGKNASAKGKPARKKKSK
jgi:hypothetical protein